MLSSVCRSDSREARGGELSHPENKLTKQTAWLPPATHSQNGTLQRLYLSNWISACGLLNVQHQQGFNGSQSLERSWCCSTIIPWQTTLWRMPATRLVLTNCNWISCTLNWIGLNEPLPVCLFCCHEIVLLIACHWFLFTHLMLHDAGYTSWF